MDVFMPTAPQPLAIEAADGYRLGGLGWFGAPGPARPLAVIHAATSVQCRYYSRFAAWLHARGHDVILYDYRGIGLSRPARLRGLRASWADWGARDAEAALAYARARFPDRPLDAIGHSFGGWAIALAPSAVHLRRIATVGAQFAYWRDYAAGQRWPMVLKWHVAMPLITALCGYFPGKRLGWLEDTPAGVVRDWAWPTPRFETRPGGRRLLREQGRYPAAAVRAPLLAISTTDDPFCTPAAVERMLAYFPASPSRHLRIAPGDIGVAQIGHFAFFHSRFEGALWPLVGDWLAAGAEASRTASAR
ncbi:alpha/beta fold hydrolase [Bordetella hinzii]|nr:alpha/beta fold hydrolase [Bordetella hinzii]QWF43642.1 alpha/beta fold hydrolase [Bordetella hinzii]QWF48180.1 alpha/beta fold hydrolase [Bordetella hinzii]QWF52717.1 alpha/beta fold hydrolase [Bordetella hinzii]QWF57206.1 alpha/beta fold hydrolase [Bordetella hinzii]